MRKKRQKQMPLMSPKIDHPQAHELEAINGIICQTSTICDHVMQDLYNDRPAPAKSGANGMTAEQILRAAIVKMLFGFTYQELAFHMVDSHCIRRFCQIGIADKGFKKSVLNKNIKALSERTWQAINQDLVNYAKDQKIEKGRKVRIDCTVVESNIHPPSDSSLLWDAVRVLSRLLHKVQDNYGVKLSHFQNHQRRAKKRMVAIQYAKTNKQRKPAYKDLLKVTRKSIRYAHAAIDQINASAMVSPAVLLLSCDLKQFAKLAQQVVHQAERRVLHGESVPAGEKIVSLFEPHTDIIVKDRRDTFYGHKVCLTGGASNLIIDCLITDGNPADTDLTETMLERQKQIYDRYPLKIALDGGFASKDNLAIAKGMKIKDVCFAKKRGLKVEDMCRSQWVYKRLRRFRAGIESGISWIKRCFGFARCTWKGLRSFKSYVWASIVSANLLTIARKQLA
jgi:IS5 family transposase